VIVLLLALLAQAEFEPLYREAWEQRIKTLGPHHTKTLESARDLGLYLARHGKKEAAREPLQQALALGASGEIFEALERWGEAADAYGKSGDARGLLRAADRLTGAEAVRAYRALLSISADESVRAAALHNLAANEEEGDRADAERHYREALALRSRLLPANDPELATTRLNLASLLLRQEKAAEAASLARAALRAFEASLGAEHDLVATASSTLAAALAVEGDVPGSEKLFRRALAIRGNADDCENLADLLEQTGRTPEAARLRARAQTLRREGR
jgi:tetratricopeptide (TPR) repeat protein